MMILWNSYSYFITYANLHNFTPELHYGEGGNILDKWIRARVEGLAMEIEEGLDAYDYPRVVRAIRPFVEDLSTWYIRRSRDRFQNGDKGALQTLNCVLWRFIHVTAPILPFTAETMYQGMLIEKDAPESIHLRDWVPADRVLVEESRELFKKMQIIREAASRGNAARKEAQLPVRQPLLSVAFGLSNEADFDESLLSLLRDELNVKRVVFEKDSSLKEDVVVKEFDKTITPELRREGLLREVLRALQDARKKLGFSVGEEARLKYFANDDEVAEVLTKEVSVVMRVLKVAELEKVKAKDGLMEVLSDRLFVGKK